MWRIAYFIDRIKDRIEVCFWKFARHLIIKGYGCNCETSDIDDFPDMYKTPQDVRLSNGRCASCKAKEAVEWIDKHIELLLFY